MGVPFGARLFCIKVLGTVLYLEGYRAESLDSDYQVWPGALLHALETLWSKVREWSTLGRRNCGGQRSGPRRIVEGTWLESSEQEWGSTWAHSVCSDCKSGWGAR